MKTTTNRFTNPLIEAQQKCKEAIIIAAEKTLEAIQLMKQKGFIEDYSYVLEPNNAGYKFTIDQEVNWGECTAPLYFITGLMKSRLVIRATPSMWFNYDIEKEGKSKIETATAYGYYDALNSEEALQAFIDRNNAHIDQIIEELTAL